MDPTAMLVLTATVPEKVEAQSDKQKVQQMFSDNLKATVKWQKTEDKNKKHDEEM